MATYLMLGSFTEQGIKNIKDTTERAASFQALAKKSGVEVRDIYWTMGPYDVMVMLEASDEETVNALMLKAGTLGNIRTTMLRAYSAAEMKKVLAKMPD